MIRRVALLAGISLALLLCSAGAFHPADNPPARDANQAMSTPLTFDLGLGTAFADDPTCATFSMYEHNELDKCKKECTGGRKSCVKKEVCGEGKCPPPGYCYACMKH